MYTRADLALPDQMTLAEVVREANRLLNRHPELVDSTPFSERTVYYYVQKGLLPRRAGRGPGTTYPRRFVHRLLFIRLLQRRGLSLDTIHEHYLRDAMRKVDDATIERVLTGDEPLEIGYQGDFPGDAVDTGRSRNALIPLGDTDRKPQPRQTMPRRSSWSDAIPLPPARAGIVREEPPLEAQKLASFRRAKARGMPLEDHPDSATGDTSRRISMGPDAELLVRKTITASQERKLQHIARLIAEILEDSK